MSIKDRIKALVKEAELYRSQSLLNQSKEKYLALLKLVEKDESTSKNIKLISDIKARIKSVHDEITEIEEADKESPELSEDVQNLIRSLFSFSQNQATAAIEGAVALAKFGQYDQAVKELERLVKEGPIPLQAAINLLRCHLSLASPDVAINQYKRWASREELGKGDLKYLRKFLDDHFKKKGIAFEIPETYGTGTSPEKKEIEEKSDDLIDLSSIGIELTGGKFKGKVMEFDVSFQSGNNVSIIIPPTKKDLVDVFKKGLRLPNIQCNSPIAIFNGSGVVSGNSNITTGPKRGSYSIDITIDGK
jgi:tetratricopeptide (TPR) repeat protein